MQYFLLLGNQNLDMQSLYLQQYRFSDVNDI